MTTSIKLYCGCLLNESPRYQSINGELLPILAGAALHNKDTKAALKQQGWLMDDEGDNISLINEIWGDLTFLYWAWKNRADDYWGVCHYRRKWNECDLGLADPRKLYITQAIQLCENNMRLQYEAYHGIFPAYDLSMSLAKKGKIPLSEAMLESAWNQGSIYSCNMARGSRDLMNRFCELTFATMAPLYNEAFSLCHSISGYQKRSIAFAAERLITAIILNAEYFFGVDIVKPARWEFIPEKTLID
jgi:hypothetical protein